jgi:hypothetical protein
MLRCPTVIARRGRLSTILQFLWRCLVLLHRWAGVLLCLMFVAWFGSALAIIYVKFPELSAAEQRSGAASLNPLDIRLSPGEAIGRLRAGDFDRVANALETRRVAVADPQARILEVSRMQLATLYGRPIYRVEVPGRQPRVVFADTGELLGEVSTQLALRAAQEFAHHAGWPSAAILPEPRVVQADQWSISGSLHAHRPLHLVQLQNALGTELYISGSTGEVVRDTQRRERVLNYFAAVTHWLYPTVLRRHPQAWSWTVDILAGAGVVLATSGLWLGIARWRRSPVLSGGRSPYRGLMRWHHLTGLVFGLTALTWVFSGWLSMNPAGLNHDEGPSEEETLVFSGSPLIPSDFSALQALPAGEIVAAELLHFERQPFYVLTDRQGHTSLQYAGSEPAARTPGVATLLARATSLMPGTALTHTLMNEFDEYYYTNHQSGYQLPLPVLRLQFADAQATRFYVDVQTGRIVGRSTRRNRIYRWLYNGLHSFDFKWLRERRPLWDVVVVSFCLGGLTLSMIGVVAASRRLKKKVGVGRRESGAQAEETNGVRSAHSP